MSQSAVSITEEHHHVGSPIVAPGSPAASPRTVAARAELETTVEQKETTLSGVCSFGELALQSDEPRNATCKAEVEGTMVAVISRENYDKYVKNTRTGEIVAFYNRRFGNHLTKKQVVNLAFLSVTRDVPQGCTV